MVFSEMVMSKPGFERFTNKFVKHPITSQLYKSTVGAYGGEVHYDSNGHMVYDTRMVRPQVVAGISAGTSIIGDRLLRQFDDHVMQHPYDMLTRHPRRFFDILLHSQAPRQRGTTEQIVANIERLGLSDYYGAHPWGIEIKKPEILSQGIAYQDVLRSKEINSPHLNDIDPLQAVREVTTYIRYVHDTRGPIGDLIGDIMFLKKEGNVVSNPVLNIPDVVYTPSKRRIKRMKKDMIKKINRTKLQDGQKLALTQQELQGVKTGIKAVFDREHKATDVLEHMFYTGFEIARRTDDARAVRDALNALVESYGDPDILGLVKSYIKRGRPTLPDNRGGWFMRKAFPLHNKVHLSANPDHTETVRNMAFQSVQDFLKAA